MVLDSGDEVFIGRSMGHTQTYSEQVAAQVDAEIRTLLEQAMEDCKQRLVAHKRELALVAKYLLENETMGAEAFEAVFTGEKAPELAPETESETAKAAPAEQPATEGQAERNAAATSETPRD